MYIMPFFEWETTSGALWSDQVTFFLNGQDPCRELGPWDVYRLTRNVAHEPSEHASVAAGECQNRMIHDLYYYINSMLRYSHIMD